MRCSKASHIVRGYKAKLTIKTKPIRAASVEKKMKKGETSARFEKKKRLKEDNDNEVFTSLDESSGKE